MRSEVLVLRAACRVLRVDISLVSGVLGLYRWSGVEYRLRALGSEQGLRQSVTNAKRVLLSSFFHHLLAVQLSGSCRAIMKEARIEMWRMMLTGNLVTGPDISDLIADSDSEDEANFVLAVALRPCLNPLWKLQLAGRRRFHGLGLYDAVLYLVKDFLGVRTMPHHNM